MASFKTSAVLIALCLLASASASKSDNHAALQAIVKESGLPAIGYLVLDAGEVKDIQAAGLRQLNGTTPVSVDDKWHIGGCAQAMTATVLARLIEKKTLSWNATLSTAIGNVSPGFARVTVRQLLTHTSGLPLEFPKIDMLSRQRNLAEAQLLRYIIVRNALSRAPERRPGTTSAFSNIGYTVAGRVAENVTGRPWDVLLREELFDPLGIKNWGLGSPGIDNPGEQPWGHIKKRGKWIPIAPGMCADFPLFLAPASGLHISLRDWARFVRAHLLGGKSGLLQQKTFDELHRTELSDRAAGWKVGRRLGIVKNTTVWWQVGSNLRSFAGLALFPEWDQAVLVVTNGFDCSNYDLLKRSLLKVWREILVPQLGPAKK